MSWDNPAFSFDTFSTCCVKFKPGIASEDVRSVNLNEAAFKICWPVPVSFWFHCPDPPIPPEGNLFALEVPSPTRHSECVVSLRCFPPAASLRKEKYFSWERWTISTVQTHVIVGVTQRSLKSTTDQKAYRSPRIPASPPSIYRKLS